MAVFAPEVRVVVGTEVRPLERSRYGDTRSALGRAFFDYDLMRYVAPNERRRLKAVTSLYGAILFDCFRWGDVHVTADCAGAACWLPPAVPASNFWRDARAGMLALPLRFGLRGFRTLLDYHAVAMRLQQAHASMPHWYLAAIGVEPSRQGQGLGTALMRPILERADAEGLPCYLETHRESNVRLYERNGFEICERSEVAGHPLSVWGMLRQPR